MPIPTRPADLAVYWQRRIPEKPETGWRPSSHVDGDDCWACRDAAAHRDAHPELYRTEGGKA